MRKYSLQLHQFMQKDLESCRSKGSDEEKIIECCSQICTSSWNRIRQSLIAYAFETDEEEIDFFKNIKPLFTSEIEYYNLMLHAQLFRPLYGTDAMRKFWARESLRLEKFIESNAEFYSYYKDGRTNYDRIFYLRKYNEGNEEQHPEITELEKKTSTSSDRLLAECLALEKYNQYVQKQLNLLNTLTNGNEQHGTNNKAN